MNLIECCQKAKDGDVLVYPIEPNCEYEFDISLQYNIITFKKGKNSWWTFAEFVDHFSNDYTGSLVFSNDWFLRRTVNTEPLIFDVENCDIDIVREELCKVKGFVNITQEQWKFMLDNNCKHDVTLTFKPNSKVQEILK